MQWSTSNLIRWSEVVDDRSGTKEYEIQASLHPDFSVGVLTEAHQQPIASQALPQVSRIIIGSRAIDRAL